MNQVLSLRIIMGVAISSTVIIAYLFSPFAFALNSFSVDLEAGNSQSLTIDDAVQTGLDGSTDMTVEAWVKFETLPGSGINSAIVNKAISAGDNRSYGFYYSGTDTKLRWVNQSDGFVGTDVGVDWSPSNGAWYHVAVSKTGTAITFYVNGVQQGATQTGTSDIFNSTAPFIIGADGNGFSHFDGLIDDVRVWNVARTGSEISTNKNQELGGSEPGLVGYWTLNNVLTDSTSNGNSLMNNNGAVFSIDVPFPVAPPLPPFEIRKSANESVTNSAALQNDDHLAVSVEAGKTYIVEGAIFAASPSATPDIRIAFEVPSGSDMSIGHISAAGAAVDGGLLETSGASSVRIQLPANTSVPIMIKGTVVAGATGVLQLKWAQWGSNATAVTVKKGSYLRVEEI